MRIESLRPEFVDSVPAQLEAGVLYVSQKYRTVIHLCCCGCGREVVTPLGPARWSMSVVGDRVTLSPSIGNWSYPCRSHYWIRSNRVEWAGQLSARKIAEVKRRDSRDHRQNYGSWKAGDAPATNALEKILAWVRNRAKF